MKIKKRFIISLVVILTAEFSANATKLQATQYSIYRCQHPNIGFVTTGSAIYSHASSDVLDFNYSTGKMV